MSLSSVEIFTGIYQDNVWDKGSGNGSTPEYTRDYRTFLTRILNFLKVRLVTDIGCGDWQFSKLIDWSGFEYTGVDCVEFLIAENNVSFGTKTDAGSIRFIHKDIINEGWDQPTEVFIMKDILQHWPNSVIDKILPQLKKICKYILITNCCFQEYYHQQDITLGDFRPLSYKMVPLAAYEPILLFGFQSKQVIVIHGDLLTDADYKFRHQES